MTKSLSNVIKSQFVYVNQFDKKVIDSGYDILPHLKLEEHESDALDNKSLYETACINLKQQEKKLLEKKDKILAQANKEAEEILKKAKEEANNHAQAIREEAKEKGYKEGIEEASLHIEKKQKELNDLIQKQNMAYENKKKELEPEFANLIIDLINKITGILIEDKSVIQHLIHRAFISADSSHEYTIRLGNQDFDMIKDEKEKLFDFLNKDINVDIILDKNLQKNQCIIETDTGIIDCSLDVQLNNLSQDIKLLAGI